MVGQDKLRDFVTAINCCYVLAKSGLIFVHDLGYSAFVYRESDLVLVDTLNLPGGPKESESVHSFIWGVAKQYCESHNI